MLTVIMNKKRVMVGVFQLFLILLLLLLMNQYLSFTQNVAASSMHKPLISRTEPLSNAYEWPRRMLDGGSGAQPHKMHHHAHHHTYTDHTDLSSGSSSSDSAPLHVVNGGAAATGDTQAHGCTSPSLHCANNGTTIDPRYGVEKRLVPTGPNPLHN